MTRARRPAWLLSYETTDISDDIADVVTRIRYTDYLKDQSDELEIVIQDTEGLWRGPWYPAQGDRIDLKLGYDGEELLPCGRFEVDDVEMAGPPDTVTVRAMAAGMGSPLRTVETRGFEGVGLDAIVGQLATELGMSVVGSPSSDLLRRVTQSSETRLAFCKRLAEQHGYAFTVRGDQLVFFAIGELEAAPVVQTIGRTELKRYRFQNKAQQTYVACEVTFFDAESGQLITKRVDYANVRPRSIGASGSGSGAAATAPSTMIQFGSRGDQVRDWQRWLAGRGLYDYTIDGIFGPITDAGTRTFQEQAQIQVDGIVGPETYGAAIALGFLPAVSGPLTGVAGDVLRERIRVESVAQAEVQAESLLRAANRLQVTGTLDVPGNQRLVAGCKVELTDMGRLSGQYLVDKSVHTMSRRGGYETQLEVSFV